MGDFIVGLAIGAALGGGLLWAWGRLRVQAIRDRAKADVIADRATLMERLQGQTEQIHQLQKALQDRDQKLDAKKPATAPPPKLKPPKSPPCNNKCRRESNRCKNGSAPAPTGKANAEN